MTTHSDTQALAAIAERHAKATADRTRYDHAGHPYGMIEIEGMCVSISGFTRHPDKPDRLASCVIDDIEHILHAKADIDTLLKAVADRDATIAETNAMCMAIVDALEWSGDGYSWNPTHGDYRERPIDAVSRAAREYRAEVARLTAEREMERAAGEHIVVALRAERDEANQRAEAAAKEERERIVAWLRKETETESIVETARAAWAYANAIERCEHADAIACDANPQQEQ